MKENKNRNMKQSVILFIYLFFFIYLFIFFAVALCRKSEFLHFFYILNNTPTPTGEGKRRNEFAEWHISGMTCGMT